MNPVESRLPRAARSRMRERTDAAYRSRMEAARRELAFEMEDAGHAGLSVLRLKKGYSQSKLAELVNTNQPHIAKIEAMQICPKLPTAIKLAKVLGVSVDEITKHVKVEE